MRAKRPCFGCKNRGTERCPLFGSGIKIEQILATNCRWYVPAATYNKGAIIKCQKK